MQTGNYCLILHTHLPWVLHHGTWPHGVDWLTEAVCECYIPLLNVINDLVSEGNSPKLTIGLSPVLCEQLEHPDFPDIFIEYCSQKVEWASRDFADFTHRKWDAHHIYLAQYWAEWYSARRREFIEKYDSSIVQAFRKLQDSGAIEVITCGATHGYFPLLGADSSINLQIKTAVENYKKHFGRDPRGIWLPECAYRPSYEWRSLIPVFPIHQKRLRPGIEQFLSRYGLNYFVTDEDLLVRSHPLGVFLDTTKDRFLGINAPSFDHKPHEFNRSPLNLYNVSSSEQTGYGTAVCFTRHRNISMQVWSGTIGYPGQPDYLDFHKKHFGSMLRYWRVTDNKADMMYKLLYHPDWVRDKIDMQSNHFIHHIENTCNYYNNQTGRTATLTTPFDTELFGHWWFEGPEFLRSVFRGLNNSPWVSPATASEQIIRTNPREVIALPEGSWGENNNHDVWSNESTRWTWESIYNDEYRLLRLYSSLPAERGEMLNRLLKQTLRELLLAQSSDWQFLIHTQSARDYAEQRFSFHHSDFNRLVSIIETYLETNTISADDMQYVEETESRNSIFPEIDPDWWHDPFEE